MTVSPRVALVLFGALALLAMSPWATPPIALAAGAAFGLGIGNAWPGRTRAAAKWLLQASVVGLGFGIPLATVARAGLSGIGYTIAGIAFTLALGTLLGRWLRIERETSLLITVGTGICGGSAIAAVGQAIGAKAEAMTVSLATVFMLNAVALYLFPPIGALLHLSPHQFAVWAAIAIHDTSSVVGAAAVYGQDALHDATVLKLARALWIIPLTLVAAHVTRRRAAEARAQSRANATGDAGRGGEAPETEGAESGPALPWFIGVFLLATMVRSVMPAGGLPALGVLVSAARTGLSLTLFLIGAGLTRATLRQVGARPFAQGVLLWMCVAGATLGAVYAWVGS